MRKRGLGGANSAAVAISLGAILSCSAEVPSGRNSISPPASSVGVETPVPFLVNAPSTTPASTSTAPLPASATGVKAACASLKDAISPGPAPLRRLTRAEYEATVQALLGQPPPPLVAFPPEVRGLGFANNADSQNVSTTLIERYEQAGTNLAGIFVANAARFANCDLTTGGEACVDAFVRGLGHKAYRRPLTEAEVARLKVVYQDGVALENAQAGAEMVVEVMLQSSAFLYRPEYGAEIVSEGIVRLAPYEMATRLSYLIWGTPPDDLLYQAAFDNQLQTREQILAQATRLFADPRSQKMVDAFHYEWLDLAKVGEIERDAAAYPGFSLALPALLQEETRRFIEEIFTKDNGTLSALLQAPYTLLNPELAQYFGASVLGTGWTRVTKGANRDAGLLTQSGLLASHSHPDQSSPVRRGKFIREAFLCQALPPPPPGLVITVPSLDPNLTTRQRFSQHASDPACAGCHRLIDPMGLGFENFDATGRWRDEEGGLPIDASGELVDADVAGVFMGPVELAQKLAASELVANCVVRQWSRFSYARGESAEDACTLDKLTTTLKGSGGHLPTLLRALVDTDAFLYRKAIQP